MPVIAVLCVLLLVAPSFAGEVCFAPEQADRLLEEVETCRELVPMLRSLAERDAEVERLQKERIRVLEGQNEELLAMNEAAIKQAELAEKAGRGSWWERALNAGKWIGLGVVLGFAVGAGR